MPEFQDNLRRAAELAFNAVCNQKTEQLLWLGAQHCRCSLADCRLERFADSGFIGQTHYYIGRLRSRPGLAYSLAALPGN